MNMTDYFEFNGILIGELWRGTVMKMNKLKGLLFEKTSLKDKLFENLQHLTNQNAHFV